MAEVIKHTYQLKRGTAERWAQLNPVLAQGEPGFVYDQNKLKIGDGFTPWNALPYINEGAVFNAPTRDGFPRKGNVNTIYKAQDEVALYQWNDISNSYQLLSSGEQLIDELVKEVDEVKEQLSNIEEFLKGTIILYGGSATDNITLLEEEEENA